MYTSANLGKGVAALEARDGGAGRVKGAQLRWRRLACQQVLDAVRQVGVYPQLAVALHLHGLGLKFYDRA